MTVQTVINSVQQDLGLTIQSLASQTTLLDYVDRIHKECLHTGPFSAFNRSVQTVATVSGTSSYTITSLASVDTVFDRTTSRELFAFGATGVPPQTTITQGRGLMKGVIPNAYRFLAPTTLIVMPTPLGVVSLEVHGQNEVATLATTASTLLLPEDALPLVVAGVNALAAAFLKQGTIAQMWMQRYDQLRRNDVAAPVVGLAAGQPE